jgi:hypothetical protein
MKSLQREKEKLRFRCILWRSHNGGRIGNTVDIRLNRVSALRNSMPRIERCCLLKRLAIKRARSSGSETATEG